jgi:hypothetical protein
LALACGAIVGAIAWIWRGEAAAAFVIGGGIFLSLLLAGLIGDIIKSCV